MTRMGVISIIQSESPALKPYGTDPSPCRAPGVDVRDGECDGRIEAAQERRVQIHLPVGGSDDHRALAGVEAVHLPEQHTQQLSRRLMHVAAPVERGRRIM